MKFRGIEAIENSASSHSCSIALNVNGETKRVVSGNINY
jgi:hypothetical protein